MEFKDFFLHLKIGSLMDMECQDFLEIYLQ